MNNTESKKMLSIIVPTKNRAEHINRLGEALRPSLYANQALELLVIDDGSRLAEADIIRTVVESLPRSRYFRNPTSKGAPFSRNRGLDNSLGTFIWFLDDDDIARPSTIASVTALLLTGKPPCFLVLPAEIRRGEQIIATVRPDSTRNNFASYRDIGHQVNTSCTIFRRDVFKQVGGWDERLLAGQDTDLFLRAAEITEPVCISTDPVIIQVGHPGRITQGVLRQQTAKVQMLRKHWHRFTWRRRLYYIATLVLFAPAWRVLLDHRRSSKVRP